MLEEFLMPKSRKKSKLMNLHQRGKKKKVVYLFQDYVGKINFCFLYLQELGSLWAVNFFNQMTAYNKVIEVTF